MTLTIRVIYRDGQLRPLEPVTLREGEQVEIVIRQLSEEDALRAALHDLVRWPDPADDPHPEVEAEAGAIRQAFGVGRPVSEMIIEDRGEG
jgi:predicted DNA-binding antitoxin AbrB/MazE fold protein